MPESTVPGRVVGRDGVLGSVDGTFGRVAGRVDGVNPPLGRLTLGRVEGVLTFGRLGGRLTLGRLTFGELIFGRDPPKFGVLVGGRDGIDGRAPPP